MAGVARWKEKRKRSGRGRKCKREELDVILNLNSNYCTSTQNNSQDHVQMRSVAATLSVHTKVTRQGPTNLCSANDPGLPSGLRAPAVQNMAVVSRSPTIPMIVAMASLQACVPTAPAWIADTMYDTWRGRGPNSS